MEKIIQVISGAKGGGAELLVRELHKIYLSQNLEAHAVYLSGYSDPSSEKEVFLGANPRSPLNVFRLRKILKEQSCNASGNIAVHVHLTWPFFYVALASLGLSKIKLFYTEHSTTNKRRNIHLLRLLERFFYARYSRIICISQGVEKALFHWVGFALAKRLVTIPNGSRIYSLAERPSLTGRLPRLVSVGSLTSRKNFATAIKAIAQIKDEIGLYTIVGEGPEGYRLEQIIKKMRLEGKVRLLGWSDTIETQLHAADIQLVPSQWEGFGLVAVEGMSTGLPVVASNVDGLREVLDEYNPSVTLVNEPLSVDEWVSAIRKVIADIHVQGADCLACSSRKQAEKFTLGQMAERYLDVYRLA
ncbi:glycosyltransferase family 4 protein [Marinobacterium stanieri]|uniref:glycosyltransferase family 4 protein n=1 Tax=Marinobacterium stanieri TaxID=49186 RepID=UPI003A91AA67